MGDTYDVGNIAGSNSMNSREREFFSKYGNALEQQADLIAQQHGLEEEGQEKTLDVLLRELEGKKNEYVVQGALLQCSKGTCSRQTLMHKGKELESVPVQREAYTRIQVPEDREASINKRIPACVDDCKGGLRDNREGEVNIQGFGNCGDITGKVALEDLLARAGLTEREAEAREAIEAGKGTCHCLMKLNESWENLALAGEYLTGYFDISPDLVEYERDRCSPSYLRFNGKEGINMMSMLFCSFEGGIITARESGQRIIEPESIFTELEEELLEKFSDTFAYGNWSDEKKMCAQEIWNKFYIEYGYDPMFVAGLIGNVFGEGNCGLLQYSDEWGKYFSTYKRGMTITDIKMAETACFKTSLGVGMVQWSSQNRKETLYNHYLSYQDKDGALSTEQLIAAEVQTIHYELKYDDTYNNIPTTYRNETEGIGNTGECIKLSTCILFKDYETPSTHTEVDRQTGYILTKGVEEDAQNASSEDQIPAVVRRILAAKVSYVFFMEEP